MRVEGAPVRPESTFFADHSATLVAATILAALGASLISNAAGPIGSALWGRISDVATAGAVLLFLAMVGIFCTTFTVVQGMRESVT